MTWAPVHCQPTSSRAAAQHSIVISALPGVSICLLAVLLIGSGSLREAQDWRCCSTGETADELTAALLDLLLALGDLFLELIVTEHRHIHEIDEHVVDR